ncbi:hypothetical protein HanXRQr2_Chr13g0614181 [Helianthus annuus]|uniref:Disease resistance N-terminal domain-containing protein n=1 Tax=Helianthus annuus TaxID=4232 RepID=A0A9K3ELN4_HELAN|nr:hypothetical protein HanXRQr2_Chr13g0614181 [Helianthus annuus]
MLFLISTHLIYLHFHTIQTKNYSHSNFQFTFSLLTMAEAAAAALVKVIFEKLADEAFKKYACSQNIHSELKQLGSTLSQIQALLNDASHKEITDESVSLWLTHLQHLAYDIDDVLDEEIYKSRTGFQQDRSRE